MFASPNQVPKCSWLRKRRYWLNKNMGNPSGKEGRSERAVSVPSLAIPSPDQGGQQEPSRSFGRSVTTPKGQTLWGTPGMEMQVSLETLGRCWETGIALQGVTAKVGRKCEMASQVISTLCLLVTDLCGSPPWLRGNGLRTSR